MTSIHFTSHNIRANGKLLEEYVEVISSPHDFSIVLCQDLGTSGLTSLRKLRSIFPSVNTLANSQASNINRISAILVGPGWAVLRAYFSQTGAFVGVVIGAGDHLLAVASVYLPPGLDFIGCRYTEQKGLSKKTELREEASSTYQELTKWLNSLPPNLQWVVGGDFNETRIPLDRMASDHMLRRYYFPKRSRVKFIDTFLSQVSGLDVWRFLHPDQEGWTRYSSPTSAARLDYFLMDAKRSGAPPTMSICHSSDKSSDHLAIFLDFPFPNVITSSPRPWTVRRPRLPCEGILPELAEHIAEAWTGSHRVWGLDSIQSFSDLVLSCTGNALGWKGGPARSPRSLERPILSMISSLRLLATASSMLSLLPNDPLAGRWREIVAFSLPPLQRKGIVPSLVTLDTLDRWLSANLPRSLACLRLAMLDQSAQSRFNEIEAKLFRNMNDRSKWLQIIGLSPPSSPPPSRSQDSGQRFSH